MNEERFAFESRGLKDKQLLRIKTDDAMMQRPEAI